MSGRDRMGNMARSAPENDPTDTNLEVGHRKRRAAGIPAVLKALKMSEEQMGARRTALTLARVNQPSGFDCPGCAWPDPKHTSSFEFCENGAKAVTWEATVYRAGPDLFAEHSVAELWGWSDHALEDAGRLTHPMRYDADSDRFV